MPFDKKTATDIADQRAKQPLGKIDDEAQLHQTLTLRKLSENSHRARIRPRGLKSGDFSPDALRKECIFIVLNQAITCAYTLL